jgi:CheY-like chemotaxis protein
MTEMIDRCCPYCGAALKWIPMRWFGRGTFECDRCGEFPDFSSGIGAGYAARTPFLRLSSPAPTPNALVDGTRPRVLMIDDSNAERDLYALMLEGYMTVLTATRGTEGLQRASAEHPDVIVLDVMMPGMDGWEVCRRLKSDPGTAAIPVIMLTAQDEPTLTAQASQHGAAALLIKPCPVEKLTAAIASAIQQHA